MRISRADAENMVVEQFCRDFLVEQRRILDLDSPEAMNWCWRFSSKYPDIQAALGADLHQIRRSILGRHAGPYV